MKIVKVKKDESSSIDVLSESRGLPEAQRVLSHLTDEYRNFTKHLRQMSEMVRQLRGVNKIARQELAKKMVGMADSMAGTWKGIVSEYNKL